MFQRYIGIDYSGQGYPTRSYAGLAVCTVDAKGNHHFPCPSKGGPEHWSRENIAYWLVDRLREQNIPTLVGIDHAFSFPLEYFRWHLPGGDWDDFLDDFREYWPTERCGVTVRSQYIKQLMRMMGIEKGQFRFGLPNWFRLTDPRGAKSAFDFLVKDGEVATSTHAGLPWLRCIRHKVEKEKVQFWPFDGWQIREGRSVIVEVYPRLWKGSVPSKGTTSHRKDAYVIARWMWEADKGDRLRKFFRPNLSDVQCNQARREGWIFGQMDPFHRGQ